MPQSRTSSYHICAPRQNEAVFVADVDTVIDPQRFSLSTICELAGGCTPPERFFRSGASNQQHRTRIREVDLPTSTMIPAEVDGDEPEHKEEENDGQHYPSDLATCKVQLQSLHLAVPNQGLSAFPDRVHSHKCTSADTYIRPTRYSARRTSVVYFRGEAGDPV